MSTVRKTHTEAWWEKAPAHVIRCTAHYKDGTPCRAEAHPGALVCRKHGAAAPLVLAAAATRIQYSVDEAARQLIEWMNDANVDMRERVKIAKDLLDRGGLGATSKHLVAVGPADPVEALFRAIAADPDGLVDTTNVVPGKVVTFDAAQAAIDAREDTPTLNELFGRENPLLDLDEVVEAEVVDDDEVPTVTDRPPTWLQADLDREALRKAGLW